jgi:hypothetical protein
MKDCYTIVHIKEINSKYFILSNYKHYNEIVYFGFENIKDALDSKDKFDVGMWKIKKIKS